MRLLADDHLVRADHDVVRERGERVGRRVAALDGEERGQRAAHVDERRVEAADGGELQLEPVGRELVRVRARVRALTLALALP